MRILSCTYNMDTACVDVVFDDGSTLSIDTLAVEDALEIGISRQADVDYLIYNKPKEYAQLVLSGRLENYIKGPTMHGLED